MYVPNIKNITIIDYVNIIYNTKCNTYVIHVLKRDIIKQLLDVTCIKIVLSIV